MKKISLMAALLLSSQAQAALNAGDLMFTAFNADEDGFSLATFVDIAANSTIYFTDNEFVNGSFNSGEGKLTWNSGSNLISAGSIIRFSSIDKTTLSASFGTLTGTGDTGINATNDNIFAYVGSNVDSPVTFLAAIANGNFGSGSGNSLISSLAGTGLTVGVNAIQLTASSDYAEYNNVRSGLNTFADYKPLVADVSKWDVKGNGSFDNNVPSTTAFSVPVTTPVPEPENLAMLMAGLGLLAFKRRQVR